jgi:hypothetical protein
MEIVFEDEFATRAKRAEVLGGGVDGPVLEAPQPTRSIDVRKIRIAGVVFCKDMPVLFSCELKIGNEYPLSMRTES